MKPEQTTVPYLSLTGQVEIDQVWEKLALTLGFQLERHYPSGVEAMSTMAKRGAFAFALAYARAPETEDDLFKRTGIGNAWHLPIAVAVDRRLSAQEQEFLRLSGATCLLERPIQAAHEDIVTALIRSNQWFNASIERAPIADLLQMMCAGQQSGLVNVGCPHQAIFTSKTWSELSVSTCSSENNDSCTGWHGRLYVQKGQLIHAETPDQTGIKALAQLLALERGDVRILDMFLPPQKKSLSGRLENMLLQAAVSLDHTAAGLSEDLPGASPSLAAWGEQPAPTHRQPDTAPPDATPKTPPPPVEERKRRTPIWFAFAVVTLAIVAWMATASNKDEPAARRRTVTPAIAASASLSQSAQEPKPQEPKETPLTVSAHITDLHIPPPAQPKAENDPSPPKKTAPSVPKKKIDRQTRRKPTKAKSHTERPPAPVHRKATRAPTPPALPSATPIESATSLPAKQEVAPEQPKAVSKPVVAAPKPESNRLPSDFEVQVKLSKLTLNGGVSRSRTERALNRLMSKARTCVRQALAKEGVHRSSQLQIDGSVGARGQLRHTKVRGMKTAEACLNATFSKAKLPRADTGETPISFVLEFHTVK